MARMNKTEKQDLEYHEWCRPIVSECGWVLYGSSFNDGCSVRTVMDDSKSVVEIPHAVLRKLAEKTKKIAELENTLKSYEFMFKKVG